MKFFDNVLQLSLSRLLVPAPKHGTPKARLFTYLKNKSLHQNEFNSSRTSCYDEATCLDTAKQSIHDSPYAYQDRLSPILGKLTASADKGFITDTSFNSQQHTYDCHILLLYSISEKMCTVLLMQVVKTTWLTQFLERFELRKEIKFG